MILPVKFRSVIPILIFFFSQAPLHVSAQQREIDSMRQLLADDNIRDTARVNLLNTLSSLYQFSNPDSMSLFATQATRMAVALRYPGGKAQALLMLGISHAISGQYDKCLPLYEKALSIFRNAKDLRGEAKTLNIIAGLYYQMGRYTKALAYFRSSLSLRERLKDEPGMGAVFINMGNLHSDLGDYVGSIEYYFKGLRVFEKIGDEINTSLTLSNIASTYTDLGKYKEAEEYNSRSLKINEKNGNQRGIMQNLLNIGIICNAQERHHEALSYFMKAAAVAEASKDHYWTYLCKENIGRAYTTLKQPDKAFPYFRECLEAAEASGETTGIISGKTGMARILLLRKQPAQAIALLQDAYKLAEEEHNIPAIWEISGQLAEGYEQTGDLRRSLEYYKTYMRYHDSLRHDTAKQQTARLQFDYQMQQKEDRIKLLEQDRLIARKTFQQQRIIVIGLSAGLIIVLTMTTVLYHHRKKLKQSRKEVLLRKEAIRKQAERLEEMNDFKDKVISILSHDMRSPLNAVQGTLPLLEAGIITPEEFNEIRKEMDDQLTSIQTLIDNLVLWSKGNIENEYRQWEKINLHELISRNLELFRTSAARKNITMANEVMPGSLLEGNPNEIDAICRNLIGNAIKFTPAGGSVTVSAQEAETELTLSVTDTGIGMSREQLEKLQANQLKQHTYGTSGEKGSGLGLILCKEFIRKHGGTLTIESKVGEGSRFSVTLPCRQMEPAMI